MVGQRQWRRVVRRSPDSRNAACAEVQRCYGDSSEQIPVCRLTIDTIVSEESTTFGLPGTGERNLKFNAAHGSVCHFDLTEETQMIGTVFLATSMICTKLPFKYVSLATSYP